MEGEGLELGWPGATAREREGREWAARQNRLCGELDREEARNGKSRRTAELEAEIRREGEALTRAHTAMAERVALAERDASRREALFEAIRETVAMMSSASRRDAVLAVRMAAVLLDAGRPLHLAEAGRRVKEGWGEHFTEPALYAAKFSGAIRADMYGVLYLVRPVGDGRGEGEAWMYEALERAVELGAARYTDGGIEMTGRACAGLSARELAGAEAVAAGVTEYGEPPGLAGWLERNRRGSRRVTWAEATVGAGAALAEVGAAWARIAAKRALAPAAEAHAL